MTEAEEITPGGKAEFMKLRRTLLWVNGNDTKKLDAAIDSNTDAIVLELEDMCPATDKLAARAGAVDALKNRDFKGKERGVRINSLDSPWGREDLAAILPCVPDFIRLPKCETVEYVIGMDAILTQYELTHGIRKNTIELILMLETPLGIINGYQMASCCERVTGMGVGAGDLTSSMGVDRDVTVGSLQLLYAKQKMLMDAKAAGVQVFDTTVVCLPDQMEELNEFIRKDTENIKNMGFTGRSVSMMPQIDIINRVFAPTEEEVRLAHRLIDGYQEAMDRGESYIFVEGRFVDPPIVEKAQKVIELANQIIRRHGSLK